jgi:hypothetical protein
MSADDEHPGVPTAGRAQAVKEVVNWLRDIGRTNRKILLAIMDTFDDTELHRIAQFCAEYKRRNLVLKPTCRRQLSRQPRFEWSPELNAQFVTAVNYLGGVDKATATPILRLLTTWIAAEDQQDLPTRRNVSWKLHKYRKSFNSRMEQFRKGAQTSRVVDPDVQAGVDALAAEIMEAAEQRKKNNK